MKKLKLITAFLICLNILNVHAQQWFQVQSGTNTKLNTIDFPSSNIGYIGGNDSLILKTTDGGRNWSRLFYTGVNFSQGGSAILKLKFVSENVGFMTVGPFSGSYKTIDGGLTWTQISLSSNMCFNQGLYFWDENNGFIGGSGCFQGELIDKMQTGNWSAANVPFPSFNSENRITDIDFKNSNYGLAVSTSGYVFKTIDGGAIWDSIPTPQKDTLTSVLIIDNTLVYVGYRSANTSFGLLVSYNAGLTWQDHNNSATFLYPNFNTLHQSGDGKIYTGGFSSSMNKGVIYDSPSTFMLWGNEMVDQSINSISSHSDSIAFAVGDSGYIIVNKDLTSSLNYSKEQIINITLFPNPTSNVLNISFPNNLNLNEASIKIYSTYGQLLKAQKFNNQINVSELPSGLYLVEIESDKLNIIEKFIKK